MAMADRLLDDIDYSCCPDVIAQRQHFPTPQYSLHLKPT